VRMSQDVSMSDSQDVSMSDSQLACAAAELLAYEPNNDRLEDGLAVDAVSMRANDETGTGSKEDDDGDYDKGKEEAEEEIEEEESGDGGECVVCVVHDAGFPSCIPPCPVLLSGKAAELSDLMEKGGDFMRTFAASQQSQQTDDGEDFDDERIKEVSHIPLVLYPRVYSQFVASRHHTHPRCLIAGVFKDQNFDMDAEENRQDDERPEQVNATA